MSQLVVTVHRNSVFEDSLELLKGLSSVDLKSPLKISFIDEHGTLEAGIDGGGLFKDFIECLLRVRSHPQVLPLLQGSHGATQCVTVPLHARTVSICARMM